MWVKFYSSNQTELVDDSCSVAVADNVVPLDDDDDA